MSSSDLDDDYLEQLQAARAEQLETAAELIGSVQALYEEYRAADPEAAEALLEESIHAGNPLLDTPWRGIGPNVLSWRIQLHALEQLTPENMQAIDDNPSSVAAVILIPNVRAMRRKLRDRLSR